MLQVAIEEDLSHVSTYEVLPDFLVLFPASRPKKLIQGLPQILSKRNPRGALSRCPPVCLLTCALPREWRSN